MLSSETQHLHFDLRQNQQDMEQNQFCNKEEMKDLKMNLPEKQWQDGTSDYETNMQHK